MIEIQLKPSDIGRYVFYRPMIGAPELGRIKNYDNKTQVAWVVYKWDNQPERWEEFTACATDYADLTFDRNYD